MQNEIILLNIGNTHTQMAYCENGGIGKCIVMKTDLVDASLFDGNSRIAAACVVPEVKERLAGLDIFFLNAANAGTVDFSAADTSTLGADRVANAVEAAASCPLPAVVFDFGSAITAEVIDAQRCFCGGAIAPGRMMMRRALNLCTGQLPLTGLSEEAPQNGGCNTADAIAFGVDGGAIGMARHFLEVLKREHGEFASVIGIGGDAPFFCRELTEITAGGDDFTLRGLLRSFTGQKR